MPPFLSKQSKTRLKILAWYQMIGGLFGVLLTFWLLARTDQISGPILMVYLAAFGLYVFSIYCGRLLLTNKYLLGLNLSTLNQALQVVSFTMFGYAFMYVAGTMLLGEMNIDHGLKLGFNFSLTSSWRIYVGSDDRSINLAINFVAIYLIFFSDKLRDAVKSEKADFENEPIAEVAPDAADE
jgi:hypothetical protein